MDKDEILNELRERRNSFQKMKNEIERRRRARSHLINFVCYVNKDYEPNWHHILFCRYLEKWVNREISRLAIFVPPQHGKSEIVSRLLPAYIFGKYPDAHVMSASYGASLSTAMNRDLQRYMDSEEYLAVFPETRLFGENIRTMAKGSWLRNSDEFEVVGRKGYYRCAGVGGGLTGRNYDYGIIDDPIKDRAEADSPVDRASKIGWYATVFRTRRRDDTSGILITQTRWHEADLSGHLLTLSESSTEADQWTVVSLPGVCENPEDEAKQIEKVGLIPVRGRDPVNENEIRVREVGEALWSKCRGKPKFDEKSLSTTKASISAYNWSALYRQKPTIAEGAIFGPDFYRHFSIENSSGQMLVVLQESPTSEGVPGIKRKYPLDSLVFFQTIDATFKDKEDDDFYAVGTFCTTPDMDLLVWDIWRAKLKIPYQIAVTEKIRKGRPVNLTSSMNINEWFNLPVVPWPKELLFQAVEEAAGGIAILQAFALRGIPVRALKASSSKVVRSASVATQYFSGKVWHRAGASFVSDLETELSGFPSAAHDDQVDVVSYAGILFTYDALLRKAATTTNFVAQHGFGQDEKLETLDEQALDEALRKKEQDAKNEQRKVDQSDLATGDNVYIDGFGVINFED